MTKRKDPKDKLKVGKKPMFQSAEEMQELISKYFADCPDNRIIRLKDGEEMFVPCPTISGLCYFLGFDSRQSFYDYENKPEFAYTIKRARLFIEKEYEQQLSMTSCSGAIFALKNFGWVDKTVQDVNQTGTQRVFVNKKDEDDANDFINSIIQN